MAFLKNFIIQAMIAMCLCAFFCAIASADPVEILSVVKSSADVTADLSLGIGDQVVFSRPINEYSQNIINLDIKTKLEKIVYSGGHDPMFSPAGERLCFITSDSNLAIIDKDGKNFKILSSGGVNCSPHWSSNDNQIYSCSVVDGKMGVVLIDVESRKARVLSSRGEVEVAPSPDGKYLAFTICELNGARSVGVMRTDGTNPRKIFKGANPSGGYFQPCWSPDSKWLCLVSSDMQPASDIILFSIDGKTNINLTKDGKGNSSPSWSQDGGYICHAALVEGKGLCLSQIKLKVNSEGIENKLEVLGEQYTPDRIKDDGLAIPMPVGPDISRPLTADPIPGVIKTICLNGEWDAVFNASPTSIPNSGWQKFIIPSKFGAYVDYHYQPGKRPVWPLRGDSQKTAWFRCSFNVPAEYKNSPYIELYCLNVDDTGEYYFNGQLIGKSKVRDVPVRLRIDDKIAFGKENTLAIFVEQKNLIPQQPPMGGIRGDVYLKVYPALYIDNVIVRTSVRNKEIESHVWVRNLTDKAVQCTVSGAVNDSNGNLVLKFANKGGIQIPAASMKEVVFKKEWKAPILWGFGDYGKPYLYFVSHSIERDGGKSGNYYSKFGFREFWAEGKKFFFNGKPFFIKGDLTGGYYDNNHNRGFVSRYFQLLRDDGNINFVRQHNFTFFNDVWFDVADEMGILLEPELYLEGVDQDAIKIEQWRNFIWRNANHPSIVMYASDNEAASQGDLSPKPQIWTRLNSRSKLLRSLDPTRMVEEQGDVGLGIAEAMGFYNRQDVFNVHPYGHPLGVGMKQIMVSYKYNGRVPVHVGEIFTGGSEDPFNWWTTPAQFMRSNSMKETYANVAKWVGIDIRSVAEKGACGASVCSINRIGLYGLGTKAQVVLGPWKNEAMYYDRLTSEGGFAKNEYVPSDKFYNKPYVQIKWPSLSGAGVKARFQPALNSLCDEAINWFDPGREAYATNIVMAEIKKAFHDVDGKDEGRLNGKLVPEVVISFAPENNKSVPGIFVKLVSGKAQPLNDCSVMTDSQGTAWFQLPADGEFIATAEYQGKKYEKRFMAHYGQLSNREVAGYNNIQFIDLAGTRAEGLCIVLKEPAKIFIDNPKEIKNQFNSEEKH